MQLRNQKDIINDLKNYTLTLSKQYLFTVDHYLRNLQEGEFVKCMGQKSWFLSDKSAKCTKEAKEFTDGILQLRRQFEVAAQVIMDETEACLNRSRSSSTMLATQCIEKKFRARYDRELGEFFERVRKQDGKGSKKW